MGATSHGSVHGSIHMCEDVCVLCAVKPEEKASRINVHMYMIALHFPSKPSDKCYQ